MKKYMMICVFLVSALFSSAQEKDDKKIAKVEIKTSAVCEMCKSTIEKAMAYEKGVKKSELDVKTKVLTVWYKPDKTSEEILRKAVTGIGYDADSLPADSTAYDKLNECCKKDAHK